MKIEEDILHLMRPPGGGIPAFSTGKGSELELQKTHYSLVKDESTWTAKTIKETWWQTWERSEKWKVVLLGVPSDTGAGIRRGAAYGPRGVRESLLENDRYRKWVKGGEVVDLGDVFVNPHLLSDEMLDSSQIQRARKAMYPDAAQSQDQLPVSVLSQLKYVLQRIYELQPRVKIFVVGGDHSIAWPITEAVYAAHGSELGIVQPDAHTDLLEDRLGVEICFGTWTYHAQKLLGGKIAQLGIRATGKNQAHWESQTKVKQYWAKTILESIREGTADQLISSMVEDLKKQGVRKLYFSNDIDGTDASEASATGTPEGQGPPSTFFSSVITKLSSEFEWVAADVVEVAPPLGSEQEAKETCELAARYTVQSVSALLG